MQINILTASDIIASTYLGFKFQMQTNAINNHMSFTKEMSDYYEL